MTINEHNILINKAKDRKDGIYQYRGNYYVVKNNNFIAYANYFGEIFQIQCSFHVSLGKVDSYLRKEKLKELFL